MNRYQYPMPRTALACAAVVLMAITLGAWVIAPAKMGPGDLDVRAVAVSSAVAPAPADVAVAFGHIDVVATRDPGLISMLLRHVQTAPKHKQPT